jgi:hypothetical protein
MKTKLVLCSMVLGSCMALVAQHTAPPGSAPHTQPTFPQDQTQTPGQAPRSTTPDSSAPQAAPEASQSALGTSVEGCLSSANSSYVVTDNSGSVTQIQVPPSERSKLAPFEGKQVRVTGTPVSAGSPGAVSGSNSPVGSDASSSSRQNRSSLAATSIRMIADSCTKSSPK